MVLLRIIIHFKRKKLNPITIPGLNESVSIFSLGKKRWKIIDCIG